MSAHPIRSMPPSEQYRSGWERIFGKPEQAAPRTPEELKAAVTALFGAWGPSAAPVYDDQLETMMYGFGALSTGEPQAHPIRVFNKLCIEGRGKTVEDAVADAWRVAQRFPNPGAHEARWRKGFFVRSDRIFESDEPRWYVGGYIMVSPL